MAQSSFSSPSAHRRLVTVLSLLLINNSLFLHGAPTINTDHDVKLQRPKRHANLNNDKILINEQIVVPEQGLDFEGLLGCKYDSNVCNRHEACFDDALFGQCWDGKGSVDTAFALARSADELTDNKLQALEDTIAFLNRYHLEWKDFMTQCLLSHVLSNREQQLNGQHLVLFYDDCLTKDQILDDIALSQAPDNLDRRFVNENDKFNYYDPYVPTIKLKSMFLDLYGLVAISSTKQGSQLSRGSPSTQAPPKQGYIDSKKTVFASKAATDIAQESLMKQPRKLSMQMNEGHPSLVETLQVNNNKQALPIFSHEIKKLHDEQTSSDAAHANHLDTTDGYIIIDRDFKDQIEGTELLAFIAQINMWPMTIFTHLDANRHMLTFRVLDNVYRINASYVASSIQGNEKLIEDQLGIQIIDAGIGNPNRGEQLSVRRQNVSRLAVIALATGVLLAFILGSFAFFYFVKRNDQIRSKFVEITRMKRTSTSDYQDLCRQRVQAQTTERKFPPPEVQSVAPPRHSRVKHDSEGSSPRSSTSSWTEESVQPMNMDIMTGHLILSYMEDHLRDRHRLDADWQSLCTEEDNDEQVSCSAALSEANQRKNRYLDCLPSDHTRVRLENNDDGDYINASFISDSNPKCKYIATQGPTPSTTNAFWQMVWEQGSCVIVALARPIENGVTMCHHYWPVEGSARFRDFEVNLVSEHIWSDDYVVRNFYLRNLQTMETRTVTQFHFLTWDELCNPPSAKSVLDFRRKVNKCFRGRSSPIIVHCNDGVGRTGTYLLLDMVLNRIDKGAREINIAATLEHIRDQRPKMVKTKNQFQFVFVAVAEEVTSLLKSLPQSN